MIRIQITGEPSPGVWSWECRSTVGSLAGKSRAPLLDACRELKRMGADPFGQVGLFHGDAADWTVRCTVKTGSDTSVSDKATNAQFTKFRDMSSA